MSEEVKMPQMGESIAEGTIVRWLKQVGDSVKRDEPLFEISTDKVDAEIPAPASGVLTEIKAKEGETVAVNSVVAVIDGEGAKPAAPEPAPEAASEAPPASEKEEPKQASADAPPEKEEAEPSEPPPAKATTPKEEPEPAEPRAEPKAESSEPPPAKASTPKEESEPAEPSAPKPAPKAAPPTEASAAQPRAEAGSVEELRQTRSSPLVRKIAQEHGIDISKIEGTGISGRVTKNDILSFIENQGAAAKAAPAQAQAPAPEAAAPAAPARAPQPLRVPATAESEVGPPPFSEGDRYEIEPMSLMRRKIAERMVESRRISAHVTSSRNGRSSTHRCGAIRSSTRRT